MPRRLITVRITNLGPARAFDRTRPVRAFTGSTAADLADALVRALEVPKRGFHSVWFQLRPAGFNRATMRAGLQKLGKTVRHADSPAYVALYGDGCGGGGVLTSRGFKARFGAGSIFSRTASLALRGSLLTRQRRAAARQDVLLDSFGRLTERQKDFILGAIASGMPTRFVRAGGAR